MKKKVISVLMVFVITILLISFKKNSELGVTDPEMVLVPESPEYFGYVLHEDQNLIVNLLSKKNTEWHNTTKEIPYLLIDRMNQTEYHGVLKPVEQWIIKGETTEGQEFTLFNENDQVILEYGEQTEFFSGEEFQLLLPSYHFIHIEELVKAENYEMVSWEQEEEGWKILIQTKTDLLHEGFSRYLFSHFKEEQTGAVEKSLFQRYTLQYHLQLTGDLDQMTLLSLQTILEKDGLILENLFFEF